LSISFLMKAENGAGIVGMAVVPFASKRAMTAGSRKAPCRSKLIRATISGGVLTGATSPAHPAVLKPGIVSETAGI
jgi:hypothetical protein